MEGGGVATKTTGGITTMVGMGTVGAADGVTLRNAVMGEAMNRATSRATETAEAMNRTTTDGITKMIAVTDMDRVGEGMVMVDA